MKQLLSTTDCARQLDVAEHRLTYAHRCGKLPEPTFIVAGKRIYTNNDLRRAADYFGVTLGDEKGTHEKDIQ